MRTPCLAAAALVLLAALPARAAVPAESPWKKIQTTSPNDYLMGFHALSATEFFVGGMLMDASGGMIPTMKPVLYWTQDGGQLMKPIVQGIGNGLMSPGITNLFFRDNRTGWAVVDDSVYYKNRAQTAWKAVKTNAKPTVVHMMDDLNGVLGTETGAILRTTDGGASWTPATVPDTTASIACLFFTNDQRGWAAGVESATEAVGGPDGGDVEQTLYGNQYLFGTSDGGKTWHTVWTQTPDTAEEPGGRQVCPMFFLPDGKTGWLASATWDQTNGRAYPAHLARTTDSGKTFRDMNVPVSVGKGLFNMDVSVSYFQVMYWVDALWGHLGGTAYVAEQGSGGGASQPPIVKNVDYVTRDGGTTWERTDLGTISIDLTGGSSIATDGRLMGGQMLSIWEGWMVGETGAIYQYQRKCVHAGSIDCGDGYECTKFADKDFRCTAMAGADGTTDRDAVTGSDSTWTGEGVSPYLDILPCEGDDCPKAGGGSGCAGGAVPVSPGAWPAATLLVLLLAATRRRGH
jgi:hypothetical protein